MISDALTHTIQQALDAFKPCKTAHEVADLLRIRKIRGRPASPTDCPIAQFIKSAIPDTSSVAVDVEYHEVKISERHDGYGELSLPWEVGEFIQNFDQGQYPDLNLNITKL
jgi:hypothetical protein